VAIAHTSLAGTTIPPDAGHLPPDRNVTEPAKATVPSCILVLRFVDGDAYDVEITDYH
jgi:hypothetical protein